MKKTFLNRLFLFTCCVCISVAYGSSVAASSSTLRIGLFPWIGTGLFYIAKDKGFFAAEKLNVELVKYDDGAVGKQLLNSGHIDLIATTPETVVVLNDAGVKVKVVGILDSSKGADGIIATHGINKITDLKGKKVAFEVGSSSHLLLSYFLHQKHLSTNDLTVENLTASDAGSAFVTGKVDAAVTWEPWLSKASERSGGHLLIDSKALAIFPDFYIVRSEVVNDRARDVQAFLRAIFAARKFVSEHPQEGIKIIANNMSITEKEASEEIKTLMWLDYPQNKKYFNSSKEAQKLLQESADLWLQLGLIKNKIKASDIIDPTLLKNLY